MDIKRGWEIRIQCLKPRPDVRARGADCRVSLIRVNAEAGAEASFIEEIPIPGLMWAQVKIDSRHDYATIVFGATDVQFEVDATVGSADEELKARMDRAEKLLAKAEETIHLRDEKIRDLSKKLGEDFE